MPNRKKNRSNSALWFLALVGLIVLACLAAYVKLSGADHVPADLVRPGGRGVRGGAYRGKTDVKVPTPSFEGGRLKFTEKNATPPSQADRKVFAVNEFLKSSSVAADVRVTTITVKDAVAYLDFNDAFQEKFGTDDEGTLLEGIQRTMGQFPDVDKVKFLVGGRPIDNIGNVDLSEPIPVIR